MYEWGGNVAGKRNQGPSLRRDDNRRKLEVKRRARSRPRPEKIEQQLLFLGADFGALLALFVQHLFAAQQFEESFVGAVALIPSGADNARVAAVAVTEARTDGVKELHHSLIRHR